MTRDPTMMDSLLWSQPTSMAPAKSPKWAQNLCEKDRIRDRQNADLLKGHTRGKNSRLHTHREDFEII